MKKYSIIGIVLVVVVLIALLVVSRDGSPSEVMTIPSGPDPANTTYLIDGQRVMLINGEAVEQIEDSQARAVTKIFGSPVVGDLDGDGNTDMALILVRETGGSGTFYYLVVALQNADKTAQGTNAILLGDRIAPQGMEIRGDVVLVNYADRKPDEPMTTRPSVGVSLYAGIEGDQLVPVRPQAR